jgi:hypothetical protein
MSGAYKKEKQELLRKAEELDKKSESQLLSQCGWDLNRVFMKELRNCSGKKR